MSFKASYLASSLILALSATTLNSFSAQALEVEETGVEKGVELTYQGSYTDENSEGAYAHEHEIEASIGVTDWLQLGVSIGFEEEEFESSFDWSEIEASAKIELIDPEQAGFGLALYGSINNEFSQDDDEKDSKTYAVGVLAEQHFDKWLVRGNLFYFADMGNSEDNEYDGIDYSYQVRYQMNNNIAFGVEGYGTNTSFKDPGTEDTNEHKVGPVIYYSRELSKPSHNVAMKNNDDDDDDEEEGPETEANFGVLFGTNDDTADVTFKWGMALEF